MVTKKEQIIEKIIKEAYKEGKELEQNKKSKKKSKKVGKILKKPKAKLPSYSAKQFIKNLAAQQEPLYKEVENKYANPDIDNRSLYFREEFKREKRKAFGGFL